MFNHFSKKISPHVKAQLALAVDAEKNGDTYLAFEHLENAHVLGQESTYWHVKVHILMLLWGVRHSRVKEIFGQLFRIVGAATKTVFGLVPEGNTGGVNVSPFLKMPIASEHQAIIDNAKS